MRSLFKFFKSRSKKDDIWPLHVCIVSPFPPSNAALSEYTYTLAKYLSASPRITKITVLADEVDQESCLNEKTVEIVRCWRLNDFMTPVKLVREIWKLKPDVVHFNLIMRQFSSNRLINFVGLSAPALVKLLGLPVIVTLHSIAEIEVFDIKAIGYKYSPITNLGIRLATKLLLKADMVTVTHKHLVDILKKKYNSKKAVYIPHGTLVEPVSNCQFGSRIFLLFGKMGPYKNPQVALEAFKRVVAKYPDSGLIVAGTSHSLHPGFYESIMEEYKDVPNIRWINNYVPESEVEELFISSCGLILPYMASVWSSGVFNVACSYGRPAIASDLPDFRELKKEGAGIVLFPVGDTEGLARAMESLLNDEKLQRQLGECNLQLARKNSFKNTTEMFLRVFEQAIGQKEGT
jgi:glycosyltransferase involved in cell wall biosynthesis